MSNGFYRAFEERYRGSRELVKSRLKVYLPFIIPLKKFTTSPRSLDLGCGRGEWLELLTENGFNAYGVDLDDEMLKACRQLGLKSKKIDAVKYLKEEADESHDLISGLHIVEHLPFEKLQTLVSEALRVLKPAGLMILETPNPENIVVGSKSFYIDPTHERPIPPELLSFVVEHAGFFRVKVVRLQESKDLASNVRLSLMNVLAGASPDYSVVAQKHAEPDVVEHFDSAFSKNYGIDLNFLADNYDHQIEDRLTQTEDQQAHSQWLQNEWDTAKEKIETLSHRTGALEVELAQEQSAKEQLHSELTQTHEQLGKAQAQAEVMFQQSNERAAQAEAKAQQATERAAQAEAKAQQATERAAQAEAATQQATERAAQAEAMSQQSNERAAQAEAATQQATERAAQAEAATQKATERAAQAEAKAQQSNERAAQAEARAQQAEKAVNAVYASRSWRITAPLRWVGKSARWFVRGSIAWLTFAPMSRPRRVLRKAVIHLKLYVSARPRLKAIALRWLSPSPALKERLRKVGSQPQPEPRTSTIQQTTECAAQAEATTTVEGLEQLSPRARRIYNDLKTAIVQRHKENN